MNDRKSVLRSRTFWGAVVAIAASLLQGFDITIGAAEQAALVNLIVTVAGCAGGLVAIYGRVKARTRISTKKKEAP
ncbi:MAG: hypothetical protein ACE5EM_01350 [Sphingomonadales bacterium]